MPDTEDILASAPDGEHVEDDREDSDNFLVLLRLVQLVNFEVSLRTRSGQVCQNCLEGAKADSNHL